MVHVELFGIIKNKFTSALQCCQTNNITNYTFCKMFYYVTTVRFINPVNPDDFV